jgi:hypothetical protein
MGSGHIPVETRRQFEALYLSLNLGQLKRSIDAKLDSLYKTYEEKRKSQPVEPTRKVALHLVTCFMIKHTKVGLPS